MNNVKRSRSNFILVTALSIGFMGLGIGSIFWAMFRMWVPSNSYAVASVAPVETAPSLVLLAPDKILYPVYPAEGDNIGILTIPTLKLKWPIYQGTDVKELEKGVGHFIQSVLPGEKDNCVLSGHRETVFRQIGRLKIGDQLIVQTSAGTFTYEVNDTRIVHEDDKTVIVPTDHAVLTMTTCYPFNTPGYFPDRYIVSAALVKSE
ncbi:MAG: class D sortase [Dehalobacter sp. 4CP]|uniref:class D sortase n=1 Tax=Dehalobacter sp. CP TaxID=2594474 RepID=UPI0013CA2FBF|nr:class D sortase [Dehalobacter sp. 4CP]